MPQSRHTGASVTDRPIFVDVLVILIDILALWALAVRGRALRRALVLAAGLPVDPEPEPDSGTRAP